MLDGNFEVTVLDDVQRGISLAFVLVGLHLLALGLAGVEVGFPDFEVGQTGLFELAVGKSGEVVATGCQEGQGGHAVGLVRVDVLTVYLDGNNVLAALSFRVIDDFEFLGNAQVQERTARTFGLPLLFEQLDDVRTLERHNSVVVGKGKDLVEFSNRDFARLFAIEDVINLQVGAQTTRVRDAEV